MQRHRFITKRHRPSLWSYFRQAGRVSIAFSERAEGMVSLLIIVASAILGIIGWLTAPEINAYLEPWNLRLAMGLTVFLFFQFLILTPIRMWRDATWVVNIEEGLNGLWDLHDEGVALMNAHAQYQRDTLDWEKDTKATTKWVREWWLKADDWDKRVIEALTYFSPTEARGLKKLVVFENRLKGLNEHHTHRLNILREKLEKFGKMIESHHPALLPE